MNRFKLLVLALTLVSNSAFAADEYPDTPDRRLTPGQLCQNGKRVRYQETIVCCERAVSKTEKHEIMRTYDQQLGFQTTQLPRQDFKIDHFIPLCLGGSNHETNLWPQHKTIYVKTDPIEQITCDLLRKGSLSQARAIDFVTEAKLDPAKSEQVMTELRNLIRH